MHEILVAKLPPGACSPILNSTFAEARAEFDRYTCVSGHIQYEPGASLSDLWSFTVLREPVDRLISQYCYSRSSVAPTGNRFNELARSLDLCAFIESQEESVVSNISNVMVAHYCVLKWDGRGELEPERQLALAKEALQEFEVVGVTERMNETVDILCARLGLDPAEDVLRLNANRERIPLADVPKDVRVGLKRLNELDIELHAFAHRLHDRQRRHLMFSLAPPLLTSNTADSIEESPHVPALPLRVEFGNRKAQLRTIEIRGSAIPGPTVLAGEAFVIRVGFDAREMLDDLVVGIRISDARGRLMFGTNTRALGKRLYMAAGGSAYVDFNFHATLGVGEYWIGAALHPANQRILDYYHCVDRFARFEVAGNIGWHFEGMIKLEPTVEVIGAEVRRREEPLDSEYIQRLGRHGPALTQFCACITAKSALPQLGCGDLVAACIDVANHGNERWWSSGERQVRVSYHWLDEQGEIIVFDGERTPLPRDVRPGECVPVWAKIRTPRDAGHFLLRITLVQEFVGWFDERGSGTLEIPVVVRQVSS